MKKIIYVFMSMLLSMGLIAQTPVNINGGFELSETGQFTSRDEVSNWAPSPDENDNVTWLITDFAGNVYEGDNALTVVLGEEAVSVGGDDWSIQIINDSIPVELNEFYRVTAMAKSNKAGATMNISVNTNQYNSTGFNERGRIDNGYIVLDQVWQKLAFVIYSGATTPHVVIPLHFGGAMNEAVLPADIFIDDVQMVKSVLATAEVNAGGKNVTVNFAYPIDGESIGDIDAAFSVKVNGDDAAISEVTWNEETTIYGITGGTIDIVLESSVPQNASVTVSYDHEAGGLEYAEIPAEYGEEFIPSFTDEVVDNKSTAVSIGRNAAGERIKLYPNPLGQSNTLKIEGVNNVSKIEIISISGQTVKSVVPSSGRNVVEVNVSELRKGMYFVVLRGNDGTETLRFIK